MITIGMTFTLHKENGADESFEVYNIHNGNVCLARLGKNGERLTINKKNTWYVHERIVQAGLDTGACTIM